MKNPPSDFHRFHALVLETPELLERLQGARDVEAFVAGAVELGRASGCNFGAEDVRHALNAARRAWIERAVQ